MGHSKKQGLAAVLLLIVLLTHQKFLNNDNVLSDGSTVGSASSSSVSPATTIRQTTQRNQRLVLFLHFHKSAGSSFIDLAWQNKETVLHETNHRLGTNDRHGHLEVNRGGFRWDLVSWPFREHLRLVNCLGENGHLPTKRLSANNDSNQTYQLYQLRKEHERMQQQAHTLQHELASLHNDGISFVSTEHWFPPKQVLEHISQNYTTTTATVVLMREPMERLVSSFRFHGQGGGRCPLSIKTGRCSFREWWPAEANIHVRMLNGVPHGPGVKGLKDNACVWSMTHSSHDNKTVEEDYKAAAQSLEQHFDVVLTLDSFRRQPSRVSCVLERFLGWNSTSLPSVNVNARKQKIEEVEETDLQLAREGNQWDMRLYERAVQLEQDVFHRMNC